MLICPIYTFWGMWRTYSPDSLVAATGVQGSPCGLLAKTKPDPLEDP